MVIGALGDIHGDFTSLEQIQRRHPDASCWLSVGDVADDERRYPDPPVPLYWIKGNNEDFDLVARSSADDAPLNLHYVPNAIPVHIDALTIVGLGGTFAPTWYNHRADELPRSARPDGRDDKRRHFVREEVLRCKALSGVDIFLSHEAPRPFLVERGGRAAGSGSTKVDAGKTPINEILQAVRPRLHLFGHHHRFTESVRHGVRSVGLDLVSRSYLLVDPETLVYRRIETR